MSGTEQTFHYTKEDVRRMEQKESAAHGGQVPADSAAAAIQSVVDQADKDKAQIIDERKSNLPLPEQPPVASDFNSADASTVNVGSGRFEEPISKGNGGLREPAAGDSAVRTDGAANGVNTLGQGVGREGADGLNGLPNDAVTREAKGKAGLANTTN
ncbi:hypothetical protein AAFC00_004933 [Neodothiora populina]|uniref:SMP domain-containing protein n=1 Tax=Neodothiora populina TaxID=2781224 RepID=A0ABR3P3U3_9PEZI